ncbi:MAG TPA: hypothetical protein VNK03_00360 [Gammaproteobacteria bacterium]|nr:hypothetical protein [Gammaproteobacteria bacterium]
MSILVNDGFDFMSYHLVEYHLKRSGLIYIINNASTVHAENLMDIFKKTLV